ncbi:CIR protein [Plasmodium chabaudi chabaudi]|uniref:CIR protein n=1 Tax=Plasmodium chabaudi chabaudi TaxID=31271 RepID=A0A1D3L6V5_PLACU|nr:CIR protein [Plasmodium chabaudi chabaudi]
MSKHKQLCKLLLEGDSYFNDENVDTQKFNKHSTIKAYCRNGGCKTNEERINALNAYIFKTFKDSIKVKQRYNDYDEYLLMWISDKLLKIHKKGKGKKIGVGRMDDFTLKRAYEEYLKNHIQRLDYWVLLDMNSGLKEANLWYMSEFYKLLNLICKIITGYNNRAQTKKIYKYPADCSHQYKNLYLNISECKPYLDLLNKLKGIYDDFSSAIKKTGSNPELASKLKKLTPKDREEMDAVRGFKTYNFNTEQCKFPKKKNTKPKKTGSPGLPPPPKEPLKRDSPEPPSPQEPQRETQQSSSTESAPQLPQAPASDIQKDSPGSQGISGGTSGQLPNHGDKSQNSDDGQPDPAGNSETTKKRADIPSVQDKAQETNPATSENTGKENAQRSDITDTSNKDHKLKVSEPIPQDKQVHQPPEDENPPKENGSELKDNVKELDNTQTDTDTQDGSNPEHKNNQDNTDTPTSTEGNHNVFNWSILIKYGNLFVSRIEEYREPVTNSLHYIQTNLYEYTWPTLNKVYTTFREYSENFNIMDYFKVESKPNKLKDSETPEGGPQNKKDKEDKEDKEGGGSSLPDSEKKEPHDTQQPTPTEQRDDNPQEQHSIPKHDQTDSEQEKTSDSSLEKQSQASVNPSSDTHSTETGSKDVGTNVEDKIPQLVNSINIFKGYNRPEIAITILLIPIISLIIYKYFLSGWRKELKKKQKMKKVINLFGANKTTKTVINSSDGKKQVQIIIKSSSQKKQTKKSINFVNRKKPPFLNIYKLMMADAIPFINLFFLLIFFVYKRKRNTIE